MKEAASQFTAEYFRANYRNYVRQNPLSKMRFYRDLIAEQVPPKAGGRILDLGCAFGRFLNTLDGEWSRYGIDISEYAIRQATQAAPNNHFAVASASAPPFRGSFDAIVAFDVIEHVPDLDRVAAFVHSGLSREGAFVFVVPVYDGPFGGVVRTLDHDPTHVHKNSRSFWLEWAGRNFSVVKWTGMFRYLLPAGPYVHWPAPWLRRIAPAIAVVSRRKD